MKKYFSISILLCFLISILYLFKNYFYDRDQENEIEVSQISKTEEISDSSHQPPKEEKTQTAKTPTAETAFMVKNQSWVWQKKEFWKEKYEQDPHSSPPELTHYMLEMGDFFDLVWSQEEANVFLDRMEECLQKQNEQLQSIQVQCLEYSLQMLRKYPQLKRRAEIIQQMASERVQKIHRMTH
ncbi:hypothetical protein K2X05_11890 [bacterium]|nr:hypothetical protein [bacterium]